MRTRNYFAKALSLALAFVMILCNFQSLQVFAEDAENDNVNLGISNVATPAVTAIKDKELQPVDESLDLDALKIAGSISFKLGANDFIWEDEAPSILRKDILDANNITIGYTLDKGAELFNGIDFYEPDDINHIRMDFNAPADEESNEFEYTVYLMQNGVISEGTRTHLKGRILQNGLVIQTFDALLAQNETKVLAGSGYSAAVKQDGSLWAWGNLYVLSSGVISSSSKPTKVSDSVASVSFGWDHNMVLNKDGSLWASGAPDNGKLGDGGNGNDPTRLTPVKVLDDVASVSAGRYHTIAVKQDGSLWAWGLNTSGHLGIGTSDFYKSTPVEVSFDNVASISVGNEHSMAIKQDGSLWAWGRNNYGQLGDGTDALKRSPIKVLDDVASVSAGGDHTMAIKLDGSLWACGDNQYGQIDNGATDIHYSFFKVADDVSSVSAGRYHTMAIKQDGSLWAWGRNNYGQLGDGTTIDKSSPIKVLDNVAYVSAGENNTIVIKNDGSLWAWGRNNIGQLGDGTTIDRLNPVEILDFDDTPDPVNFSITSYSPINDQTDVPLDTSIELTFNQDISSIDWQAANPIDNRIHLMHYDGSSNAYQGVEIDVSIKSGDSKTIIIEPTSPLSPNTDYFVRILPNTIKDGSNNTFPGLDITDYKFTTVNSTSSPDKFNTTIPARLIKDILEKDKSTEYPVVWDDAFFNEKSDAYNHDLAKLCILLSNAAYANDSDAPNTYIRQAMSNLKLNDFYTTNYNDNRNTVAFSLGHKTIVSNSKEYDLLVVVIRGTPGNEEWYGNFDIGQDDTHSNFNNAKDDVLNHIKNYITKLDSRLEKKILITGHSRGAAVANLLAKDLADGVVSIGSKDDIYTYTFATPTVSTQTVVTYPNKPYNIFNLLHYDDFVPKLPLYRWGFGRYGNSISFPSALADDMMNEFQKITQGKKFGDYNNPMAVEGFTDDVFNVARNTNAFYNEKYACGFLVLTPAEYFDSLSDILIDMFSFRGISNISLLSQNAIQFTSELSPISRFFIGNTKQLTHSHTPETYIAWLNILDNNWIVNTYPAYKKTLKIACPVDIYVYDEDGRLIGTVIDNVIDDNFENPAGIILTGNNNDVKELTLSSHREFTIEIISTGEGTMTYTAADVDIDTGTLQTVMEHQNVVLTSGRHFVGSLSSSTFNQQSHDTDFDSLLYDASGDSLQEIGIDGSQNPISKVSILAYTTGGGTINGGGIHDIGDNVSVYANPDNESKFVGWYENGSIVSNSNDYVFTATSSRKLEARFASDSTTTYTINVTAGIGGSVSGGGTFNENDTVNLVATSDSGYAFDGWYESGTKIVGATAAYSFTATADRALEARFVLISSATTYTITATAGIGGSATGGGTFNENAAVTLIATPRSGYAFDGWYENGTKITGAAATYSFTAIADRTLEARFVLISSSTTYTITATAGVGGSVTGGGVFNENATVTLVATPNSGYAFNGWHENDTKIAGAAATYSFTTTANRTLEARFVLSSNESNNSNNSSSGGGSGSTSNSSSSITTDPLANLLLKIKTAVENALKKALSGQSAKATVQIKNADKITLAMLKQASDTAKKAGSSITLHFDTMSADGQTVLSRLYIKPELATIDINVSMSETRANNVKSFFEQYFTNKIAVLSLEQPGSFGMQVEIAAKVDLTGMYTKNLYFYSYDKKTNTYRRIEKSAYWIDKNGYLHFTTELAGDIVISEKPLARK